MRRALLAFLAGLAAPASTLAQTITADATTIDIAQCNGVASKDPPLGDTMSLGLTWSVAAVNSSTIASGDVFRLYAANVQPAAGQTSGSTVGSSCTTNINGGAITSNQVGSDLNATSTTMSSTETFGMAEIASKAGFNCTDDTSVTVYLCVQWLSSASAIKGYATTTITLDRTAPGAPSTPSTSPGDGVLHLSCSAGSGAATSAFVGKATSVADPTDVHYSGKASSCGQVVIENLTNNQEYKVVAYGVSASNNPSVASAEGSGTPVPTDDFWNHYRQDNGRETGGCSTAAGGAGLLLSILGLLAVRRRKP